jgi:hypothetical protein
MDVTGTLITATHCKKNLDLTDTTTIVVDGTITMVPGSINPSFVAPTIMVERKLKDELAQLYNSPEASPSSQSFPEMVKATSGVSHTDPEVPGISVALALLTTLVLTMLLVSLFIIFRGRREGEKNGIGGQEELGTGSNGKEKMANKAVELDSSQIMELGNGDMSHISELAITPIIELDAESNQVKLCRKNGTDESSGFIPLAVP